MGSPVRRRHVRKVLLPALPAYPLQVRGIDSFRAGSTERGEAVFAVLLPIDVGGEPDQAAKPRFAAVRLVEGCAEALEQLPPQTSIGQLVGVQAEPLQLAFKRLMHGGYPPMGSCKGYQEMGRPGRNTRKAAAGAGGLGQGGKTTSNQRVSMISKIASITMGTLPRRANTPRAERACLPASPSAWTTRSEAPSSTLGCSKNPGAELT